MPKGMGYKGKSGKKMMTTKPKMKKGKKVARKKK